MKKFIRLSVEHYTPEGKEFSKIDSDAAEKMTHWLDCYVDPDSIIKLGPITDMPNKTIVYLSSGDDFITKGSADKVLDFIREQCTELYSIRNL